MLFRRSLLLELISTATAALLILVGVVVAQRSGYLIQLAAKGILPNDSILTMLGFNIIRFLPMLLSLSLFLSILFTLSRWYRDSEMIIWFSAGLSIKSWLRPILTFATPVVLLILSLSLYVTPWAIDKVEIYRTQLESRDELATITPGVFKESSHADRVFFIESFDELGNVVKNIFVQSIQNQKLGIIVAQKGNRVTEKNGDNFIVLHHGRRYEGTRGGAEYSITEFEKYALRLETKEAQRSQPSTQSKPSSVLFKESTHDNNAELQWRLAMPISALVLALLAIPLSALDPRAGRSANLALALVIYIIYNNLLSILQAWVSQGKVSVHIGLWPVHLAFSGLTFYMLYRRTKQLPIFPSIHLLSFITKNKSHKRA